PLRLVAPLVLPRCLGGADADDAAVAAAIDLHLHRAVCAVDDTAVRVAAVDGIERHRGETGAVVLFPLVDPAVAVTVFFRAGQHPVLVILDSVYAAVVLRRNIDAHDL